MGDDSEWMKLPTEQKVEHKVWKARVAGYEELVKILAMTTDEKSPEFNKYAGLQKKFVTESNAIAQEKALDVVVTYAENAGSAIMGRIAQDVSNGVVAKCLNSARAKTKEKGMEVLMLYIEAEKQEPVQDALMAGLSNKNPKIVAACVMCLREALRCFGPKIIVVKPLVKQFQRLLEDRDKTVREEGKQLVVEVYRWIGAPIKPQLANLKPVQVTELEGEFENIPPGKPQQERFLRSQQDLKAKLAEQAAAGGDHADGDADEEEEEAVEEVDAYDLMEPVEIISKMPKDFYEKIEAKKWQERKEVLDALKKLTESPKLADGDYHDVVKTLKKVVAKDTNVMLVTLAAKIITDLANGLRKKFSQHASSCIDCLLEKFREKKVMVVAALREAVDACFPATTLDAISETIVEYLNHKTPTVRAETAAFLARCFSKSTTATLPKKLLKMFATPLTKLTSDSVPEIRENTYQALGTAMKVVGEKHLMPFISDMDNIKQGKIKEACEKAELISVSGKPRGGGGAKKPAAAAAAEAPRKTAPAKSAAPRPGAPPKAVKKAKPAAKSGGPSKSGAKGKKAGAADKEVAMESVLSDEAVEDKMANLLPADSIAGLGNSNWKERLAAMEKFTEVVKPMPRADIPCQACVRTVCQKPGLKENNFQVMKLKVQLLSFLASNSNFTRRSAECCLTDLVDKIGDVKNGSEVQETLSCIAEACSLEYTSQTVVDYAFSQKNPKTQSESLNWLAQAIKEFGLKLNVKPLLQHIKKAFGHTNPAVRTAAITLVGVMYMFMGATLRVFFEDEKSALLAQIDTEIEKVKDEQPPAPTRGQSKGDDMEVDNDEEDDEEEGGGGINVADLVPRTDISDKITDEIIEQMADKNWKIRNENIQKVITILNEAKFITANIGALPDALKLRLADSNKILVGHTLTICQTLATAMGPHLKSHVQVVGPGIIMCLGDSKPQIRANAVTTLNMWVEQTGLHLFVQGDNLGDALKVENPNLRMELLGWLATVMPNQKKLPVDELKLCVPHIFSCCEDRNAGVRSKAQEAMVPFMIHTGYDTFARQAGKLKPASKDTIMKLLEKARAEVPAKPSKAVAASATVTSKGKAKVVKPAAAPVEDDYDDDEPMEKAAPPTKAVKGGGKGKAAVKKPPMTAKAAAKAAAAEDDVGPVLKASNGKEGRFRDEKNMKVFKWNFTTPRGEFVEQLRTQMEPTFSRSITTQLFHTDFKMHIKAMERLQESLQNDPEATITNLDLILKWLTLRFFDTNTSMLLKALEYIQAVFEVLGEEDYHLPDQEAVSFIPYLVNKVGDPKDHVRRAIRTIFRQIGKVYPSSKLFQHVSDGLKSKNAKQRTECLEELGSLIELYGINVCQPSPAASLKLIATQIADRDNSVRSAALNSIVAAYHIIGEIVYKYVGNISDKDQGMLEERIKRSAKSRPATAPPAKAAPEVDRQRVAKPQASAKKTQERAPSGSRLQQPTKRARREFDLDLSDGEEDPTRFEMPKLISHDTGFLDEPIVLPTRRSRPPSPSLKLLSTSNDARTAIDMVIAHIASKEMTVSIQALAQIDEVFKDSAKAELLSEHVDQLLMVCSLQLKMAYTKHMAERGMAEPNSVIRLYKALIASLVALFECGSLGKEASTDVLKDLLYNLLVVLLDTRLNGTDEGPNVVRSVNVLVVKIVDKSDHTNVMCALIRLLHESLATDSSSHKYMEVIMKCLWKLVRMLPNIINHLNVDVVIGEMHKFFKDYPSHTWKSRPSDTPLRTIKTILHSMAKFKGNKIMSHLSLVDTSNSEVEAYLSKVLNSGNLTKTADQQHVNGNTDADYKTPPPPKREAAAAKTSSSKKRAKSTHDALAEIFKKIGSKENTREGLNDLYDFKQQYPEADLDPFLKKSSPFFQSYIDRGLNTIAQERDGGVEYTTRSEPAMSNSNSARSLSSISSEPTGGNNGEEEEDVNYFRERLKALCARCGLDPPKPDGTGATAGGLEPLKPSLLTQVKAQDSGSNSSLSSSSSLGTSLPNVGLPLSTAAQENESNREENRASVLDLKKRLEQIKSSMK